GPVARAPRQAAPRSHTGHRHGQKPPGRDVAALQHPGQPEPDGEPRGDAPVVADDEVPPEPPERTHALHACAATARVSAAFRRRSARVSASDTRPTYATIARTATSEPGQSTPAPSPAQKIPKLVSRTPTVNLSAFSGTRASGARTASPTAMTTKTAAAAAAAARPRRLCVLPKVITMNATS